MFVHLLEEGQFQWHHIHGMYEGETKTLQDISKAISVRVQKLAK